MGRALTLFIDASALVAIIADEAEQERFIAAARADDDPLWSPMSCWETVSSLRHSHNLSVEAARRETTDFAGELNLRLVPVGERELTLALDAYQTYGKGRHPAKLNMGDCFAYACAKANDARLLYKGDDFARTDLA
jgi:ribonuclease VapC